MREKIFGVDWSEEVDADIMSWPSSPKILFQKR
jgi:hypothetical protein